MLDTENKIPFFIKEKKLKNDSKAYEYSSKEYFSVFCEYVQGYLCERINSALRLGSTDDYTVLLDIQKMDKMFANLPDTMKTEAPMRVYRGTSLHGDLGDILSGKSDSDIYTDKGFVSTSKDKEVAKVFCALKKDAVLLDIVIPKGSLVLDDEKLPSYAGSLKLQREVLLPRNAQFRILSYDDKSRVVKALYLGQHEPLELPKVFVHSASDILSDRNKELIELYQKKSFR